LWQYGVFKNSVNGFIFTHPHPHFNVNAKGYEFLIEAAQATQSQLVSELSLSRIFYFFKRFPTYLEA